MDNKKILEQQAYFENRLVKSKKHLLKWAKRNDVFCFRLYDKDIPEVPLCVDVYYECVENAEPYSKVSAVLTLYKRPYQKAPDEEKAWLKSMQTVAERVLGIGCDSVFLKLRQRRNADADEPLIISAQKERRFSVREGNAYFYIYLGEHLDTGLFLDHRWLRRYIFKTATGKRVLNLFCYTGAFSVFASLAGAEQVVSVDLSKNYLERAKENFALNGLDFAEEDFIESDVFTFLRGAAGIEAERRFKTYSDKFKVLRTEQARFHEKYLKTKFDIIICDAPTFSNSKKTATVLDINRDWGELCSLCLQMLNTDGVLYFSCNSKTINVQAATLGEFVRMFREQTGKMVSVRDMSSTSIDEDFRNKKPHALLEFKFG